MIEHMLHMRALQIAARWTDEEPVVRSLPRQSRTTPGAPPTRPRGRGGVRVLRVVVARATR